MPIKECKHPELTYGEICVQCNECGRFDRFPFVQSDIKIVIQSHEGYPPLWKYPREFGGYYKAKGYHRKKGFECWYRDDKVMVNGTTLEDFLPSYWYPERLPYLRWWIEGRNY